MRVGKTSTAIDRPAVQGLVVDGTGAAATSDNIAVNGAWNYTVRNIYTHSSGRDGLTITDKSVDGTLVYSYFSVLELVRAGKNSFANTRHGISVFASDVMQPFTWSQIYAHANGDDGLHLEGLEVSDSVSVFDCSGCYFEGNTGNGLSLTRVALAKFSGATDANTGYGVEFGTTLNRIFFDNFSVVGNTAGATTGTQPTGFFDFADYGDGRAPGVKGTTDFVVEANLLLGNGVGAANKIIVQNAGWNVKHNFGLHYAGDQSEWGNNLVSIDVDSGNLYDTSAAGSVLRLTTGGLVLCTATAGANPRDLTCAAP